MYNIALHIKSRDWIYILIIGVFFGMFMSSLGYILLEYPWLDGAFFGVILGFSITTFSLVFISYMNKNILPRLKEVYWLPLSIVFSFLSGFLGTMVGIYIAEFISIELIPAFREQIVIISILIGILTYIVGALLYRFVKMRNQKDVIDNEYIQSRLRSLETQLNPHFLFNALNSIAELIHHDKDKAEMAILKVSSFLRNTMNEQALLTLKDEIKNVGEYIELENIRFSDKIHLEITGEIPRWSVPKFSLQLIVENAIKHSFVSNKESLNIKLSFDMRHKIIKIENDGLAMQKKSFGVGLSNLNQRLELLCKGSLSVESLERSLFYIDLGECCENTNS
ncbi:sensor histidine kinase [Sulfurimonas aquatica]|uniref:Sensor histidine kinase n=1 Tax=Sulfurimonas aquatica TaxID=2672570 RepID=A0A975B102_9BACT|nr:histidine kinase [Sulfurimonas aquatica]QSZ42135.1 sensor histidine kinase [Sulfurimonas aquatica]